MPSPSHAAPEPREAVFRLGGGQRPSTRTSNPKHGAPAGAPPRRLPNPVRGQGDAGGQPTRGWQVPGGAVGSHSPLFEWPFFFCLLVCKTGSKQVPEITEK